MLPILFQLNEPYLFLIGDCNVLTGDRVKVLDSTLETLRKMYHDYSVKGFVCAGNMAGMLCNKAEVEVYIKSLASSGSRSISRISKNCNRNSWALGCQPGWACMSLSDESSDESVPSRTLNCRPCCPGFFCPSGLTCMIRKFSSNKPGLPVPAKRTELILHETNDIILRVTL